MCRFRARSLLTVLAAALLLIGCSGQPQSSSAAQSSASVAQTSVAQTTAAVPRRRQTQVPQTQAVQTGRDPVSGLEWVALSTLPREAQSTYRLILAGGPFPYSRDGVVFQNREGVLPRRSRGSYHEYTVRTPGSSDRGARRIVCAALPECYYTDDHYDSFRRVAGGRP
jgi:ribonuclease T1